MMQDSQSHGMYLRYTFPPHPIGYIPESKLREYIDGNDPITGIPIMKEIINALTVPLRDEERNPYFPKKPKHPRLLPPDTEENLHRLFLENGWTDGLPIVLPTEERVAEMLTGTDHDPDEVVGTMAIAYYEEQLEYTVEKVAVNAVMAGARPEHFPVILAIASTQRPSLPSSTTSFASMVVVNGPIRDQIGMNYGAGALSPFNYANSVIGRAWTLLSINLGNAKLGETFMATTGHNVNYNNMCCAENEELSPFEPLHVEKGFKPEESTVSIFRGWNVLGLGLGPADSMAEALNGMPGMLRRYGTFVVDPLVAKSLREEGLTTKEEFRKYIAEKTGRTTDEINIIVVGGETNPVWITTDFGYAETVSIDKWIPKNGIRHDKNPLRMPVSSACKDGVCSI